MQNKAKSATITLTLAALFSALAFVVVSLFRIPLPIPAISFIGLKFDPKDAVLALEALILGPIPAVLSALVVSLVEMVTISETVIIGAVMNFFSSTAFILPIGIIYYRRKTLTSAVIGLLFGIFFETAAMLLWNYFITPIYTGYSRDAVASLLLPGFLPFNLVKSTLNAAITFLLYKPIITILRKANLLPKREGSGEVRKSNALPIILNVLCALVLLLAVIVLVVTKILNGE